MKWKCILFLLAVSLQLQAQFTMIHDGSNHRTITKFIPTTTGLSFSDDASISEINLQNDSIHLVYNFQGAGCNTIAQIYQKRWQVELLFKRIKQNSLPTNHVVYRFIDGAKLTRSVIAKVRHIIVEAIIVRLVTTSSLKIVHQMNGIIL